MIKMKTFKVIDLRNCEVFPNLDYRFSNLKEEADKVILERDYLGENPLHYYIDIINSELIISNNLIDIKKYLENKKRQFVWERVRAVSNNIRTVIDNKNFSSILREETEIYTPLQDYTSKIKLNYNNLEETGKVLRTLLTESIKERLKTIKENEIGLLLSGGLDSMSIGYLLSKNTKKKVVAFTLKVNENSKDVVKSRKLAEHFGIDLVEVKAKKLNR